MKFSDFKKVKVLVIGDVILDKYIIGEVTRISPEAPVPVLNITDRKHTLGGAGNVAYNVKKLGCNVELFGYRGSDTNGLILSDFIKENNIGENLYILEDYPTICKTRILANRQQLLRIDDEKIIENSQIQIKQLISNINLKLDNVDVVILSDYSKGVLTGDIVQQIITKCKDKKILVFVDPKWHTWLRFKGATCLTPNLNELEKYIGKRLTKKTEIVEAGTKILKDLELQCILITLGAEGMCLINNDLEYKFITATAREVFDVSGAGDTVISCLATIYAFSNNFELSSKIANYAAGIVVGKIGSQPILLEEIEQALKTEFN
jgi:D-beta-D-heptose 7-phosphate kinase/D-beta-D-heptose 1-phosphate adenosyltransferase